MIRIFKSIKQKFNIRILSKSASGISSVTLIIDILFYNLKIEQMVQADRNGIANELEQLAESLLGQWTTPIKS